MSAHSDSDQTEDWTPLPSGQRLPELDLLRGFAVLGIFVMNIIGFGLPLGAYFNPAVAGGIEGLDRVAFYLQDAFFDGRMRAIFCLLFGAGLALSINRAEGHGLSGAQTLHRRYCWLMVFGLIHIFVLQMPGDILFNYGLVALLIWSFVRASTRRLLITGAGLLLLATVLNLVNHASEWQDELEMLDLQARSDSGIALGEQELTALAEWKEHKEAQSLGTEQREAVERISTVQSATTWTSSWRAWSDYMFEAVSLSPSSLHLLSIAGTMLLGVVLFRNGFLIGQWSTRRYGQVIGIGLAAALAAHGISKAWAADDFADDWLLDALWMLAYEPVRILVGMAWIAALLLSAGYFGIRGPLHWLAQAGRMALTVYLLETVIATMLFFGWGFALFGELRRIELMGVVLVVQAAVLLFANLWLTRFSKGPIEALWRRLSY